ncbi:Uncharacterised protein [Dermatophilus congolensis]|uniref:Lipopolysaccharide assembly protein A domain-containing protein n=1 Tax=Dermatophilus congolensis TaxID=1863 RepID=A0A239V3D7_9MICO|nr:DUF1049 domain-containing protein [Dermatophilus congolensis]SNV16419.1 Uncharacterised protein [Dermatophilus congolensis]
MAVLGSVLMFLALGIAGFCLWAASGETAPAVTVDLFSNTLSITPATMFVLGAIAMLLMMLGVWMAFFATKRRYQSHRERRQMERREREQAAELAETRAHLDEHEERAATGSQPRVEPPVAQEHPGRLGNPDSDGEQLPPTR